MEPQRRGASFSRRQFLAQNAWIAGLALAACATPATESQPGAAPTTAGAAAVASTQVAKPAASGTVDFMGHFTPVAKGGTDPRADAMAKIEEDFKQRHPDITIRWQQTAFQEMADKFLAGFAANTAPDICLFASDGLARVNQMGALGDMLPHFKTWPQGDQDDFPKGWWDIGMSEGKKVAAPLLFTPEFLIYRKSAFDSIGVAPSKLNTWDSWLDALQRVVVDGTGKHGTEPGFDPASVKLWGTAFRYGLNTGGYLPFFQYMMVDKTGHRDIEPPAWRADSWLSDPGLQAIQFHADLITRYQVQPRSNLNMNLSDVQKFFAQGSVAAFSTATNVFPSIKTSLQFPAEDLAFGLFPSFDPNKAHGPEFLSHWSMGMSAKSKNRDATLTVISFLESASADLTLAKIGGQQPKRISTGKDTFFDAPERAYLRMVSQAIAESGSPDIASPVPTNELLIQALQKIVSQNVPVKDAVAQAKAQYDKLLSDIPPEMLPKS